MSKFQNAAQFVLQNTADVTRWRSIIVNKRKPYTYRASIQWGDDRICLHRFDPCEPDASFAHPHPWPSCMLVLSGFYDMWVGHTSNLRSRDPALVVEVTLAPGSIYHMNDRNTWHKVIPRTECFSLMINGPRWDSPHRRAPTTAGKGLDGMSPTEFARHLEQFETLITDYLASSGNEFSHEQD